MAERSESQLNFTQAVSVRNHQPLFNFAGQYNPEQGYVTGDIVVDDIFNPSKLWMSVDGSYFMRSFNPIPPLGSNQYWIGFDLTDGFGRNLTPSLHNSSVGTSHSTIGSGTSNPDVFVNQNSVVDVISKIIPDEKEGTYVISGSFQFQQATTDSYIEFWIRLGDGIYVDIEDSRRHAVNSGTSNIFSISCSTQTRINLSAGTQVNIAVRSLGGASWIKARSLSLIKVVSID